MRRCGWRMESRRRSKAARARLALTGANPALLAGQDPAKVSRANIAASKANKPAMELITRHAINWSILAAATPAWAKLVFPGLDAEEGVAKLWDAIFAASRATSEDPVGAWKKHGKELHDRVAFLNEKRFHSLRFHSADGATDLTVGLADDHLWAGGGGMSGNGVFCNSEHPDRGVLYDAAQGSRGWLRQGVEAALAPRHADRKHPLPVCGRAHR